MKNILAICGLVLLSSTATANNLETFDGTALTTVYGTTDSQFPLGYNNCIICKDTAKLDLDKIVFIEEEDLFDLGFDTAEYLPEGFDPYKVYVDLDAIEFIEEQETELGFNTAEYLPEGFDPYAAPADFNSISYMETEEDIYPQIDTQSLLPDGFDPYIRTSEADKSCQLAYEPDTL